MATTLPKVAIKLSLQMSFEKVRIFGKGGGGGGAGHQWLSTWHFLFAGRRMELFVCGEGEGRGMESSGSLVPYNSRKSSAVGNQ